MCRRQMRHQRCTAERNLFMIVNDSVDWMGLAAWGDFLNDRNVLGHHHNLRARHLLYHRIAFDVIDMSVACSQNLDVLEIESQFFNRCLDQRNISLKVAVDKNVTLRSCDEE